MACLKMKTYLKDTVKTVRLNRWENEVCKLALVRKMNEMEFCRLINGTRPAYDPEGDETLWTAVLKMAFEDHDSRAFDKVWEYNGTAHEDVVSYTMDGNYLSTLVAAVGPVVEDWTKFEKNDRLYALNAKLDALEAEAFKEAYNAKKEAA